MSRYRCILIAGLIACGSRVTAAAEPALIPSTDVPWGVYDAGTVLVARIDVTRLTIDELQATARAVLGPQVGGAAGFLAEAQARLAELHTAGVELIYLGAASPVDEDGEEIDPATWAYVRHRPGRGQAVQAWVHQTFDVTGSLLAFKAVDDRSLLVWRQGLEPKPGLSTQRRAALQQAFGESRGGIATFAWSLPDAMRDDVAKTLSEFGEFTQEPYKSMFKRLGVSAEHLRFGTGGIWLGDDPRLRMEVVLSDPQAAVDMALALSEAAALLKQALEEDPDSGHAVSLLAALLEIGTFGHVDRSVVWEVGPEQLKPAIPVIIKVLDAAQAELQTAR